jgi:hypothetical protein
MKKYFFFIPLIIILIFSSRYFVFTKHLENRKPMSYVYKIPISQVRKNVSAIFSDGKFHNLDFEVGYSPSEREINKVTDDENKNHFFINRFAWDSSGEDSEIYYNWWGKLKLIPSYHIILDSLSTNQTKITIESFPKVIAGTDFSLNHMVPYITPRTVKVKPSTIEEYKIIRMIGSKGEMSKP